MRPVLSTTSLRTVGTREAIVAAQRLEYAGLEIWAEHLWARGDDPTAVGALAASAGVALTVHGPGRDLNVTSANAGIREESRRQYRAALDDARRMGARVVTFHPGALSSSRDDPRDYWPPLVEFFRELAVAADRDGIVIGVENMEERRGEFITDPADVVRLVREVGVPGLGLTLDIAHLLFNHKPVRGEGLEPVLRHVHLSGSTATLVHVPLGEGVYDLRPPLRALASFYSGMVAIEGYAAGRELETVAANRAVFDRLMTEVRSSV